MLPRVNFELRIMMVLWTVVARRIVTVPQTAVLPRAAKVIRIIVIPQIFLIPQAVVAVQITVVTRITTAPE
ncbi:unnamed protein product [Gongylonema pulchrum]|uniref:Secreted protein n=1 Tax=Gongylonema pulchrum TaxID=637853 RepID=A0A183D8L4_9BILA|nr:unnamed protein product [Gongylonema pulchrum]